MDRSDLMKSINKLRPLLPETIKIPEDVKSFENRQEYSFFIKQLLLTLDLSAVQQNDVLKVLRVLPPSHVLREVVEAICNATTGFGKLALVDLLKSILTTWFLEELLEEKLLRQNAWHTCKLLVNLPTKIANAVKSELPKSFSSVPYSTLLTVALSNHLVKTAQKLRRTEECDLSKGCSLLGLLGRHYSEAFDILIPFLLKSSENFVFRTVAQRLVRGVPADLKENVIILVSYRIPCYKQMDWLLEDSVVTDSRVTHVVVNKLLLEKYFSCDRVVKNVMGYLLSSPARKEVACRAAVEVFHAWSDKYLMKHQNLEQQLYLTKALLILCGFLKTGFALDEESRTRCVSSCVHGVQNHLGDPDETLRNYGMIVGQEFLCLCEPGVPKRQFPIAAKFKHLFDYMSTTEEVVREINLEIPEEASKNSAVDSDDDSQPDDDDDDDDDVLYKIDSGCKVPLYLRDCLQLLVPGKEGENVEQIKICLQHLPDLIRKFRQELKDIAAELSRLVLFAEEAPRVFPQIPSLKREALVSLMIHEPRSSTKYLIDAFYSIHVNHRHRMEILSSIMLASDRFSDEDPTTSREQKAPTTGNTAPKLKKSDILKNLDKLITSEGRVNSQWTSDDYENFEETENEVVEKHWKTVIAERVANKTRRFASTTRTQVKENRFGEVAGYFFYPLMREFNPDVPLRFDSDDSFLLVKILQTLGVVMNAARNSPQASQMGRRLLEYCELFMYHDHDLIRQACAFAIGSVLLTVPEEASKVPSYADCSELDAWVNGAMSDLVPKFNMSVPAAGTKINFSMERVASSGIEELD